MSVSQSVNLLRNLINSIITNILPEDKWAASIKPWKDEQRFLYQKLVWKYYPDVGISKEHYIILLSLQIANSSSTYLWSVLVYKTWLCILLILIKNKYVLRPSYQQLWGLVFCVVLWVQMLFQNLRYLKYAP